MEYEAAAARVTPGDVGCYCSTCFPESIDSRRDHRGSQGAGVVLVGTRATAQRPPLAGTKVMAESQEDGVLRTVDA